MKARDKQIRLVRDWLWKVAKMGIEWVSGLLNGGGNMSWYYSSSSQTFSLFMYLSHFSCLSSLSILSPYIYGRIRDRNSYILTSVSIKASAVDKLKNVNKKTKQPSERAKTKCNTRLMPFNPFCSHFAKHKHLNCPILYRV